MASNWLYCCLLIAGVLCSTTPGSSRQTLFPPGPLDNPIRIIDKYVQEEIFNTLSEEDKKYLLYYDSLYRGTYLWYVGNGLCVYTTARIRPPVGEYEVINFGRFPCTPVIPTTTATPTSPTTIKTIPTATTTPETTPTATTTPETTPTATTTPETTPTTITTNGTTPATTATTGTTSAATTTPETTPTTTATTGTTSASSTTTGTTSITTTKTETTTSVE